MEVMCGTRYAVCATFIILCGVCCAFTEPGFLSIDCGGKTNGTDTETNITWVTDHNYVVGGHTENINDSNLPFYLQSRRIFPYPLRKSCYVLPITPDVPFLLRVYFVGSNYNEQIPSFSYSIETQGMLALRNPTSQTQPPLPSEKILVSGGEVVYICLIRTSPDVDPFISSIELRTLRQGMYNPVSPGLMLHSVGRNNVGAEKTVRYPQDIFDRLWDPSSIKGANNVSLPDLIATNNTANHPPSSVMQTAAVADLQLLNFISEPITESLLLLYFAEIEKPNRSQSRTFDIQINNDPGFRNISLVRNLSAIELDFATNLPMFQFALYKDPASNRGPILNAFEWYRRVPTASLTSLQDVQALAAIKKSFNVSDWVSDPCFAISWEGIQCSNSPPLVRVEEINLSGRNLRGSIPSNIANLTALINISLNNNHLTGGLPNLSSLAKLERLHLENNSLIGEVPNWLSQLHNLKELFIQNNNFRGVIPQKLLDTRSLIIRRSGNRYLCMRREECVPSWNSISSSQSNRGKTRIVAGIITGGIALIALLLVAGTLVYRKHFNEDVKGSTSGNTESIHVRGQDFSMVLVPNSSKSRSFTLDEIITATENFTHTIGKGGFGSVFLGKLQEGKQIAVKVLSSFSKQGAVEFLNEIDLLSRVHHKNLASLLGYCNGSRELMLAYEYMPGGSLKDHLYGPKAGNYPMLDWKTRLKIALDAAHGLEYLHVGCTPKIIHRDVKTANILLDTNFNAKVADFGLSRVTIDGETSHVTTTVKGTPGYLDPEYFSTQMLTEKSDVYSFGVVLLEIICARRPINVKVSEEEINLIRWVTPYVQVNKDPYKISEIVDKRLQPNDYDTTSVFHVAKLAIRCAGADPSIRPTISEVVAEIKVGIKYENENSVLAIVGDDVIEISGEYGDQVNSQVSISDSNESKEMGSSENSSKFLPEDNPNVICI